MTGEGVLFCTVVVESTGRRVRRNGTLIDSCAPMRGISVTSISSSRPGAAVGVMRRSSPATRPWLVSVYSPTNVAPGSRSMRKLAGSATRTGAGTLVSKVAVSRKS